MSVNHHNGLRKWGITHLPTLRQITLIRAPDTQKKGPTL